MADAMELRARMARMLECPICMCQFTTPKVLPCQHTYCKACLEKLKTNKPTIKCPSCRRRHTIPQKSIDEFPPNVTISELIELQSSTQESSTPEEPEDDKSELEANLELLESSTRYLRGINEGSNEELVILMRGEAVKTEISRTFRRYQDILKDREKILKAKVHAMVETDTKKRSEWQEKVTGKLNEAAELTAKAKGDVSSGDQGSLSQQASALSKEIFQVATSMPMTSQYHFTFGSQVLKTHITTYGSIVKETPQDMRRATLSRPCSIIDDIPDSRPIAVDYYPSYKPLHVSEMQANNQDAAPISPFGLTSSPNGNILATDIENHRVVVFSKKLEYLSQFGHKGEGDGELNRPTGIATDNHGMIFVADQLNNRIQVFNSSYKYRYQFGERGTNPKQFIYPVGITVDKENRVFICDSGNFRIQILQTDGTPIFCFGSREHFINQPMHVTLSMGKVFVTDQKQYIRVFEQEHEQHKVYLSQPAGITVDQFGNMIVGDSSGRLVVLRETGEALCHIGTCGKGPGQLVEPRGVAITQEGHIAVADTLVHRIQIFGVELMHDELEFTD